MGPAIRVLLVQDNPDYEDFLKKQLEEIQDTRFAISPVSSLKSALVYLTQHTPDIILLELSLPDSRGLKTFETIQNYAPLLPVVVLTSLAEELTALQAVQRGAQDYLLKTLDEPRLLVRVTRCAMERHRVKKALINLSFIDDLTGLYNRRGFTALAEQQKKLSERSDKGFLLFLMDLDGFKSINDVHGHLEGDQALLHTAEILRKTFRQSDLLSRIGGDEFAVIAIEAGRETTPVISQRFKKLLEEHHHRKKTPYQIALSMGSAYYDPRKPVSFEQLFESADGTLYEQKRRRAPRPV